MKYFRSDFESDKETTSNYDYRLSTIFYDVYVKDNRFYISKDSEKSILARFDFYYNEIKNNIYPVYFDDDVKLANEETKFQQVIGLPSEVLFTTDNKIKSQKEILSSITFTDDLKVDFNEDGTREANAINYLIEHGIYFLDIDDENLFESDGFLIDHAEINYPIFIDESKLDEDILEEKETVEKIFMDFSSPYILDDEGLKLVNKHFASASLSSLARSVFVENYAFPNPFSNQEIPLVKRGVLTVYKRFFVALVMKNLNKYYNSIEGFKNNYSGMSVLDHDMNFAFSKSRFIYFGQNFNMYADAKRKIYLEDGIVKEKIGHDDYFFDHADKKYIGKYFDFVVKSYHINHKEVNMMPFEILNMMGLPYPALKYVQYFDFEHGSKKDFLKLLPFKEDISPEKHEIHLPRKYDTGFLVLPYENKCRDNLIFYNRKLLKKGIYFTDLSFGNPNIYKDMRLITSMSSYKFFNCFFDNDEIEQEMRSGLSSLYTDVVKRIDDIDDSYRDDLFSVIHDYSSIVDGKRIISFINKAFKELNSGEMFNLIANRFAYNEDKNVVVKLTDDATSDEYLNVYQFLLKLIVEYLKQHTDFYGMDLSSRLYYQSMSMFRDEYFLDPYLPIPDVYRGRNFIAYRDETGIYFDSDDKDAIYNLFEIYQHLKNSDKYIYKYISSPISIYSGEKLTEIDADCYNFLGLPEIFLYYNHFDTPKNLLKVIQFKDNISLYNQKNHHSLLSQDIQLMRYFIFSKILSHGLYMPHSNFLADGFLTRLTYSKAFKGDLLFEFIQPEIVAPLTIYFQQKFSLEGDDAISFNLKEYKYFTYSPFLSSYLHFFYKYLYLYTKNEMLGLENPYCIASYKSGEYYIAPGSNFVAVSKDNTPGSFSFLKSDLPSIVVCFDKMITDAKNNRYSDKFADELNLTQCGIPLIMLPIFFKYWKSKSIDCIPVIDLDYKDIDVKYDVKDIFVLDKESNEDYKLRKYLRDNGLILGSEYAPDINKELYYRNDLRFAYYIKKDKPTLTSMYLKPSPVFLNLLLDEFLTKLKDTVGEYYKFEMNFFAFKKYVISQYNKDGNFFYTLTDILFKNSYFALDTALSSISKVVMKTSDNEDMSVDYFIGFILIKYIFFLEEEIFNQAKKEIQ